MSPDGSLVKVPANTVGGFSVSVAVKFHTSLDSNEPVLSARESSARMTCFSMTFTAPAKIGSGPHRGSGPVSSDQRDGGGGGGPCDVGPRGAHMPRSRAVAPHPGPCYSRNECRIMRSPHQGTAAQPCTALPPSAGPRPPAPPPAPPGHRAGLKYFLCKIGA